MTIVGVPRETKQDEHRVALTPAGARELVDAGHSVLVESGAGAGSGFSDAEFTAAGADIAPDARSVFAVAELVLKVKEPQPSEVPLLGRGHTLFTYLHLAADPGLARELAATGARCIAYETIEDARGRLPLLAPMSEVAGKVAAQVAAFHLTRSAGGPGVLPGGATGVAPADVMVIGGGVAGAAAASVARGLGARVTVLDRSLDRLGELDALYRGSVEVVYSSPLEIEARLERTDVVIGAVLLHGARAPWVIRRADLPRLKPGALLIDIAIDQGGCFETSRPTTHEEPTFVVDGVVHYCVANIPGDVPRTSTRALTNATLPYVLRLCELGVVRALQADPGFLRGLNLACGRATCRPVAAATGLEYMDAGEALGADYGTRPASRARTSA